MAEGQTLNMNDHDLLIRVDTKLGNITEEIRGLRDDNNRRITKLEDSKLGKEEFGAYKQEHEKDAEKILKNIDEAIGGIANRMTANELETKRHGLWIAGAAAVLGTLQFVAPIIIKYFIQ